MKTLNKENMNAFVKFMARKYGVKIVTEKSREFQYLHLLTTTLDVENVTAWLQKFSITLPRMIWFSFFIGEGTVPMLIDQLVIICHEFAHVLQWKKDRAEFAVNYLRSDSKRAHYEAEAMHTNIDLLWSLGIVPNTKAMADMLKAYRVTSADIEVTKKHLDIYKKAAKAGARTSQIAKLACEWWEV